MPHSRTSAFPLVLAAALTCSAQQVIVQPSAIAQVEVVSPQAPGFSACVAHLVGTDQPRNLAAWLPYAIIIRNNSQQALAAISAVWTVAFGGGPLVHSASVDAQWFDVPGRQIQPGETVLAIPAGILKQARDVKPFADGRGIGNLQNFQPAQRIEISVAAVVFTTGQFAGSDADHVYEQWQAEIEAPRSVAAAVLEMKATQPIPDILAWLQTLATRRSPRSSGDFNADVKGSTARGMLNTYSTRGQAALYSMAQGMLQDRAFPLHR
jgi:hypothetical protein